MPRPATTMTPPPMPPASSSSWMVGPAEDIRPGARWPPPARGGRLGLPPSGSTAEFVQQPVARAPSPAGAGYRRHHALSTRGGVVAGLARLQRFPPPLEKGRL